MNERHNSPTIGCVSFNGSINQYNANELQAVVNKLVENGIRQIRLALNSPGGNVSGGIHLYSWLKSLPIELTTYNTGDIDSIANAIFLAGKKRKATRASRFMLHGVARSFNTEGNISLGEVQLKEALNYVDQDNQRIAELIARETKFTIDELRAAFAKRTDTVISLKQASEKGLIHGVEEFEIPINSVSMVAFTKD